MPDPDASKTQAESQPQPSAFPDPADDLSSETVYHLTGAEMIAAEQREVDQENTRLGHAIAFLNNHMPMFGVRVCRSTLDESWKDGPDEDRTTMMDDAPDDLSKLLLKAMGNAARYADQCFRESLDDRPVD